MKKNHFANCCKRLKEQIKLVFFVLLIGFTQNIMAQNSTNGIDENLLEDLILQARDEQSLQPFQKLRQESFEATLTGTQENPAITVRSFGSARIELVGNTLIIVGSFTGLEGELATQLAGGGHIHEGLAGTNGPISGTPNSTTPQGPALLLDITTDNTNINGSFVNVFRLTDAQVGLLQARSLYINIHSQANLGGELRGQILPVSDVALLANMSGANEVPSIVANSNGNIVFDLQGNILTASGSFSGLEGDIAVDLAGGAHIHDAVAGRNGPISILLNIKASDDNRSGVFLASQNTFELTDAQVDLLLSQGNYVNIHSQANRGGELRGQIAPLTNAAFRVQLAGVQEVPAAVNTTANGRLLVSYDSGNNQLIVSGSYNGLQGALATDIAGGIHLHTGIAGTNGPVAILLKTTPDDANNGVFLPENNTFNLDEPGVILAEGETPESFVDGLFARGIYTNIHSEAFRAGELRGQVMPLAQAYLATNLDARNEIPLTTSDGFGNIQFELRGNQLISSGSFSNLSSALNVELAGGVHGHLGSAIETGDIQFLLNTTPSADNLSGVFEAANNVVELTDQQREAILTGNIYINVHSLINVPGELRGQILRDDNAFPAISNITDVNMGSRFRPSRFTVSWEEALDPNEDLVVYTLEASLNDNFDALLINEKLAETSFAPQRPQAIALFRILVREFLEARRTRSVAVLNLRVLSSDGSVSAIGDTFEQKITLNLLRSLLSVRGFNKSQVQKEMAQLESLERADAFGTTVFPNPVTNGIINISAKGALISKMNVAVYDAVGNLVYQNSYSNMDSNKTVSINDANLASGIYIVRMTDDDGNFNSSEKVIVK